MVSGDFDGDGRDEIAVGSAGVNYAGLNAAGGVRVMNLVGSTWIVQSEIHPGGAYPGAPQATSTATSTTTAVSTSRSVHNHDDGAEEGAGTVQVLYETELIFADGFD